MHIAILMTNTDDSAFANAQPKDGEKFRQLFAGLRPKWRFTVFSVKDGEFPADITAFDGVIVTGSPASVHDTAAWVPRLFGVIRDIEARKQPLFGVCFGHQAIAMALGGVVADNPKGWVFGLTETNHQTPASWMPAETAAIKLYAAHREQVTVLPDGARRLGGNEACPIGSFAVQDHVFTTQYHPEITPDFIAALTEELAGKLPDEVIDTARASLVQTAETVRMLGWIVAFFEQGSGQRGE